MKYFSAFLLFFALLVIFTAANEVEKDSTKTAEDICRQPKLVGKCRALFPRFYYNIATGECADFGYGGCNGNGNNFEKKEDCEKLCKGIKPLEDKA